MRSALRSTVRAALHSTCLFAVLAASVTALPTTAFADAFVLVHGAWHDGSAWNGVRERLEATGHTVVAPSMPGRADDGREASEVTLADYVDTVTAAVTELRNAAGEPVILVAHSSGAFVVQEAAPKVADALERIVFHQPIALGDGQAQTDVIPAEIATGLRTAAEANGSAVPPDEGFVRGALIAGNTPVEQDRVLALLVPEPIALFDTPIDAKPFAALDVPVASVRATADTSLPAGSYEAMAEALGATRTVDIEGGHEALVVQPDAFADALIEVTADE